MISNTQEAVRPTTQQSAGVDSAAPGLNAIRPPDVSMVFVERVPISYARRFGVLGLNGDNGVMRVATASPEQWSVLDTLAVHLGQPVVALPAPAGEIAAAINQAYSRQESRVEAVIEGIDVSDDAELASVLSGGDLLDNDTAAPVGQAGQRHSVRGCQAPGQRRARSAVRGSPAGRLRIDGVLYDYVQPPKSLQEEIVSRIKVLGRMNIAEKRLAQDGRTTVSVGERIVDLRISSLPTSHGERVVLRLLDKSARLYRLPELGMSRQDLETFRRLIRHTHGIILVTGPTGSGKSTTLYAALQELDSKELNILTLEDPDRV